MSTPTALDALPPSVGDAPVAALLLRDLVADLVAGDHAGVVDPAAVTGDDDGRFHLDTTTTTRRATDLVHAPLAAPELFRGATPDGRTDVYAAACLALTRYLGAAPVPVSAVGQRPTAAARLGALRHAQRTVPARLGTLPEPFRSVVAPAVAKERYLRPEPAVLLAGLDAAFAATGGIAAARTRVHRLVVLARVFEPGAESALRVPTVAATTTSATAAAAPLHLPIRTLPALRPSSRAARVALIAAVTVVATGGVAVAAVVGLSGGSPRPVPQALPTLVSPSPSSSGSPRTSVVATTSSAAPAPATSAAPVGAAAGGGNGDAGDDGSNAGRGGAGSTGRNSGSGGGSAPRTNRPAAPPTLFTPPPAPPPTSENPPSTPVDTTPVDPPTDTPTDPSTSPPVETSPPPTDPTTSPAATSPAPSDTTPAPSDTPTVDAPAADSTPTP